MSSGVEASRPIGSAFPYRRDPSTSVGMTRAGIRKPEFGIRKRKSDFGKCICYMPFAM